MKQRLCEAIIIAGLLMMLTACGGDSTAQNQTGSQSENQTQSETQKESQSGSQTQVQSDGDIDVDLTALSSTMVYSEVYSMMVTPEDYMGKVVKMEGSFALYEDEATGQQYFACLISDATACCSQGIEFVLEGDKKYPDDYPELGTEITVTGTFGTYEEGENTYIE